MENVCEMLFEINTKYTLDVLELSS